MSEVNPYGGGSGKKSSKLLKNIKDQANEWYNIDLKSNSFSDSATELAAFCSENKKQLIIRDWSIVDFEPLKENGFEPPNSFTILKELAHLNPIVIGFVRNAIDVWISRGQPDLDSFFSAYNNYIVALKALDIPIFKYDDFTESPEMVLRQMCDMMDMEFENVLDGAASYMKVNGDIQRGNSSRGEQLSKIHPMKRQIIPQVKIKALNSNELMKNANRKLDYGINYFDKISYPTYIAKRLGQFYFRQKRKFI